MLEYLLTLILRLIVKEWLNDSFKRKSFKFFLDTYIHFFARG